ncbi:hypothetical protein EKO27_g10608 [Xylaria grammica]|uniref:NACHT domain-containing protein n=1 Tax=Xylaria grammica TaxID=363999 RepID=A0A439CQR9_9PEZI|nr:hypothetical protein EKO27_g10608 [Xylaria grammica]
MASAPTNPTASLQAALGEFQSVLSDEDRKRLQSIKDKPEVDAAIQFTATLDQENAAKRKGPSISSRLYSVLLSVQQFSNVVDTFVSANPSIAALVWGTVKLTMLIVTNFLTYYEETSKAFVDFDRWSPRFSQYQSLFPTSARLQGAICDFHASIIRCCKQIVYMSQRSFNSLTKSFQSELGSHILIIKNAAQEVSFEVELAKAQSDVEEQQFQRQERTSALSHRSAITAFISKYNDEISEAQRWRAAVNRRNKAENSQRRLDHISTFDHVTAFNQARSKRYHSTGGWVFQTPEWCNWKHEGGSSSLVGSGKTVLSQDTMLDLLVSKTAIFPTNYFVIDSLDECEAKDRRKILQILDATVKRSPSKVKVLIASRDSLENEITGAFSQVTRLRMNAPEAASDLELFAHQTLSERMNMGQLAVGNIVSFEAIRDAIVSGAQGMFLWVALEIDDVCSQVCEEDVLIALQNLPETLTEILSRALLRILIQGNQHIAKEAFKWISVAKRPLLLDELQDALSIKLMSLHSRAERRPENIQNLPAWCANLVEIDEASKSVQFVHHTVRTFLLDTSIIDPRFPKLDEFHNHVDDLDTAVGELCVTYLEWNDFKRALERPKPQTDTTIKFPEPQKMVQTALETEWQGTSVAMIGRLIPRFPKRQKQFKFDLDVVSPLDEGGGEDVSHVHSYPFLEYAKKYWILHTRLLTTVSPIYWPWRRMIMGTHHVAKTEWTVSEYSRADISILAWVQTHCHFAILRGLISAGYLEFERFYVCWCKIVEKSQSLRIVRPCLESIAQFIPSYWTAEMVSRMEMDVVAAHLLPQAYVDPRSATLSGFGLKTPVRRLLSDSRLIIDAIADVPRLLEITYLASVQFGFVDLMATLLVREPNFRSVPDWVDTEPLQLAIMAEDITVVELLLQRGANPNRPWTRIGMDPPAWDDSQVNSLPHMATGSKNLLPKSPVYYTGELVSLSGLTAERSLQTQEKNDEGPWRSASLGIRVTREIEVVASAVVDILSTDEIITLYNTPSTRTWITPLHYAALASTSTGYMVDGADLRLALLKLLLSYGADPDMSTFMGLTPIFLAINQFQPRTCEALLQAGADPTHVCGSGQNAEEYMAQIGFHQGGKWIEKYHSV